MAQLFVVDDAAQNAGLEPLPLSRIALGQIGGDAEAEHPVSEELQLLIVLVPEGQATLGPLGQYGDFARLLP